MEVVVCYLPICVHFVPKSFIATSSSDIFSRKLCLKLFVIYLSYEINLIFFNLLRSQRHHFVVRVVRASTRKLVSLATYEFIL